MDPESEPKVEGRKREVAGVVVVQTEGPVDRLTHSTPEERHAEHKVLAICELAGGGLEVCVERIHSKRPLLWGQLWRTAGLLLWSAP